MGMLPGVHRGNGRGVAVLLGVTWFSALILGIALAPRANASSGTGLSFTPASGPVGTMVTVTINPAPGSVGQSYALDAGMGSSADDACNGFNLQPILGVAPFVLSPNGTSTSFAWPSSLDQGPYWICAEPASNGGGTAYTSTQPFTVSGAVAPTQTPGTTANSVIAPVPPDGVIPGATFTISVGGWSSPAGTPPLGTSAQFTIAPGPNSGDYVLTVTVPTSQVSGTVWAIVADQQGQVYSNSFNVIVPATATTPPRPVSRPSSTSRANSATAAPSPVVVGILLAIIVVMLVAFFLRRRASLKRRMQQPIQQPRQDQPPSTHRPPDQESQEQPRQEQRSPQALSRDPRYPRQ